MPNIVITEGLDTPWELKNTESNITAATDLESINLANQNVGTLAYKPSQLFGSLKTEKDNLDKIVDAIELINEEIALYPGRIATWNEVPRTIENTDLSPIPIPPSYRFVGIADSMNNTDLSKASPVAFETLPGGATKIDEGMVIKNKAYINAVQSLVAAKPLLDAQGYTPSIESCIILIPPNPDRLPVLPNTPSWVIPNRVRTQPVELSSILPYDLLVTKNNQGEPISYKYHGYYETYNVPVNQVLPFYVPKDAAEKTLMQAAINSLQLIAATNALNSTTGLPSGVTPPVTTLGVSVEKYFDTAKYTTVVPGYRPPFSPPPEVIYGAYPPLSRENFDVTKMTKADANKFFQEPGTDRIYYIKDVSDIGVVDYRFVTAKEPFINNLTDDIKKALRGEYAEKQILLTQRSTDQTLFVTSITQRYTTFSDMATNLLKTLVNFYNDLARNLRG